MIEAIKGARVIMTIQNPQLQDPQLRPRVDMLDENTVTIVAKIVEVGELGLWIEHADYPFPRAQGKGADKLRAYILVRYDHITSIAYFPELPVVEVGEVQKIGFVDVRE